MTQAADKLLKQALELSEGERASLASSLIESLERSIDPSAEEAWSEEIRHRIADLDSGKVKTVPWEEVQQRASDKLRNG
jgi:putative addiction module component (TIGR02574 family)